MNDCIFCKIVKGEIPSAKVYEDNDVLAFLDLQPVNHGHTLVVPKEHHPNLYEIPDEILKKLIVVVKDVTSAVKKGVGADGTNVQLNNDSSAGQVVKHIHFHIIPRKKEDGLRLWPQAPYPEGEMEKVRQKIEDALKNSA